MYLSIYKTIMKHVVNTVMYQFWICIILNVA